MIAVLGTEWAQAIDDHLDTAKIILLLISADFLASDYCYSIEMKRALERHQANEARVIPILLRPVSWEGTPFSQLQSLPSDGIPLLSQRWHSLDAAFFDIVKGIRNVLQGGKLVLASTPPLPSPQIWNIPLPRNPVFTGREDLLRQLTEVLKTGEATALSQPQAISGLGGIGKTQIAIEYAYRHRRDYQAVLWTRADTREALISGYITIAKLLNLPEQDEQDQTIIIQAVVRWLRMHTSWLLILDDADDLTLVREFLPLAFLGHILLTTRSWAVGRLAQRIEVDTMDQDMGTLFLLRRAALLPYDKPLEVASSSDIATAKEIVEELGGLPLALDQTGAYLDETRCSLADFLKLYHAQRKEMLKERRGREGDHPEPVATTWSLSFERVEQQNPAAAELLRFCAFLAPNAIPETLFTRGAPYLGPVLSSVGADEFLLNEAVAALLAFTLVKRNIAMQTVSIHPLVQAVVKDTLSEASQVEWAQRVIQAVHFAFPKSDLVQETQYSLYIFQVQACVTIIERYNLTLPEGLSLINQASHFLLKNAQYEDAESLLLRALAISKAIWGPADPNTATSLNDLAALYATQGKYVQAETLYQQALTILEHQLGSNQSNTAVSLNNLAVLYASQGNYKEAEQLYQRTLAVAEQQLGAQHDIATRLNNLAVLYKRQGKYAEAEPLYVRALAISEQQLGAEHPNTATSLNNLAGLYYNQGKYVEAESLYQRALAIREQQLGAEHPHTAQSLNNLASVYLAQDKYEEAEPLYQRALAIREQQLGTQHPDTASSLNNLAYIYYSKGKYEQAKSLYMQALSVYKQTLGSEHPITQRVQQGYTTLLEIMEQDDGIA